jgi:hypothetical protein
LPRSIVLDAVGFGIEMIHKGDSDNLGGLEDAEAIVLDAAAGIPNTHAVRFDTKSWNNRYLGLVFFKLTR